MGVEVTVGAYWGVMEPSKWGKTRRQKEETFHLKVCPKGHGKKKGLNSPFCPECGEATQLAERTRQVHLSAAEVYGETGWEGTCDGEPWDWMDQNDIVHSQGGCSGQSDPLIFALNLARVDGKRGDDPQSFSEPSDEDKQRVQDFLDRIGYTGPKPGLMLVCTYW